MAQADDVELHRAALQAVREASQDLARRLPGFEAGDPPEFVVNGSGTFSIGGPEGDNGLSGKKLLLDHYGPRVPIGGTALSGKDFWKPDRAGTLLARRLALAVVHAGVAREAVVQFVSFPGDEAPRLVRITTPQGDPPDAARWLQLLNCRFETTRAWGLTLPYGRCIRSQWSTRVSPDATCAADGETSASVPRQPATVRHSEPPRAGRCSCLGSGVASGLPGIDQACGGRSNSICSLSVWSKRALDLSSRARERLRVSTEALVTRHQETH